MLSLSACVAIFCTLVNSQVLPNNASTPVTRTVAPSMYPYVQARNHLLPGYNYPYYNPGGPAIPIVSYSNNRGIDGSYLYSYASADGKQVEEKGFLKDAYVDISGNPKGTLVVEGSYAYISPEGTPIQVSYVADEHGFRQSGTVIPAAGKAVVPTAVNGIKDNFQVLNPGFNKFNYENKYNYNGFYNNYRPYDPRYQYPATKYPLYNPYRSFGFNNEKEVNETPQKETS